MAMIERQINFPKIKYREIWCPIYNLPVKCNVISPYEIYPDCIINFEKFSPEKLVSHFCKVCNETLSPFWIDSKEYGEPDGFLCDNLKCQKYRKAI